MKYLNFYASNNDYNTDLNGNDSKFPNVSINLINNGKKNIHYNGIVFLEYIECDQPNYYGQIDTGVYGDLNTKIVCDWMVTAHMDDFGIGVGYSSSLFGAEEGFHVNSFSFMAEVNANRSQYFSLGQQAKSYDNQVLNTKYHAEFASTWKITNKSNYNFTSQSAFTTWDSIYIFDLHRYSNGNDNYAWDYKNRFVGRLYNLDIYKSNVLVRKFRPAMRLSDKFVSLFDMVESKFYIPTQKISYIGGPRI